MELPVIMKWLKQVFSQRYNHVDGRVGHIWGDRYWSLILEGEPPESEATTSTGSPQQRQEFATQTPMASAKRLTRIPFSSQTMNKP